MLYNRLPPTLFFLLLTCCYATAQQQVPDTAFANPEFVKITDLYQKSMTGYRGLYNGIEYTGSYPATTGHPYFEWDTLQQGSIKYQGVFYPQIGLKYDLVSNEVVVLGKQHLSISLLQDKIDFFSIREHLFIHIKEDSGTLKTAETGFYEVLYAGNIAALAKRKKNIERSSSVEAPYVFKQHNRYFVRRNNTYLPVESEKALLLLLDDQKEALKNYVRKNGLNFKKDFENSFIKVVAYYEQKKN